MVPVVSDYLVDLEGDPARLAQLKVAAREDGEAANAANLERRKTLIRYLTEAERA